MSNWRPQQKQSRRRSLGSQRDLSHHQRQLENRADHVAPATLSAVDESLHPARPGRGLHAETYRNTAMYFIRKLKNAEQLIAQPKTSVRFASSSR